MKPLYKMSKQELLMEGKRIGLKEGRDLGFQTGLYLALEVITIRSRTIL